MPATGRSSGPQDDQLPEEDRPLEIFQLDFDVDDIPLAQLEARSEAELPESPMTKQLREEEEWQSQLHKSRTHPQAMEPKLLTRPESHGSDFKLPCFHPAPTSWKDQRSPTVDHTKISFAPVKSQINVVPNRSSNDAQPWPHPPKVSPTAGPLTSPVQGRRAQSVPKIRNYGRTESHETIVIASDTDQGDAEIITKTVEHPKELEAHPGSQAFERMESTAALEASVPEILPLQSPPSGAPTESQPFHRASPHPTNGAHFGKNERPSNISNPQMVQESSKSPLTPKQTRLTPALATPAGVAKRDRGPRNKLKATRLDKADLKSVVPSEEDLLYVLMHRCRERGEAAHRSMTRIKTLEHRNFELHAEHETLTQERDDALAAEIEASERCGLLQANMEVFKSKYSKLKNCARSTYEGLEVLRQHASVQKASFRELTQLGEQFNTSLRDVRSGVQVAQKMLENKKGALAVIRSEADEAIYKSVCNSRELSAASSRIRELTKEKGRFEAHIVSLEASQQRANHTATKIHLDVSEALVKMSSRLEAIECAALCPSLVSAAVDECLELVRSMAQGKHTGAEEFRNLKIEIAQGIESVRESFQSLQASSQSDFYREAGKQLKQLKQYIGDLQFSIEQEKDSHADRVRLEERVKGLDEVIEQLRKSNAQSESYATTFQQGMDTVAEASKLHQSEPTAIWEQLQVKYGAAKSELATSEKKIRNLEDDITRLEREKSAVEVELRDTHRAHEEKLAAKTESLNAELNEKNIALEAAEALAAEARKHAEGATAQVALELEDMQAKHSFLQSVNDETETNALALRKEQDEVRSQLKIALEEVMGLKMAKEQLRAVQAHYEQARNEVERLQSTESHLKGIQQQFQVLQKEADSNRTKITSLQVQITESEKYPGIIEDLNTKLDTVGVEAKCLQQNLTEANAKAAKADALYAEILSKTARIEELEAEATASGQAQQQLQIVTKESESLKSDLTKARSDLNAAQQLIQKDADFEKRLQEKDEEIARARQLAAQVEELSQSLGAQKVESQQKDSQIVSLCLELDRIKAESQEPADCQPDDLEMLTELDGLATQESCISFLQPSQAHLPAQNDSRRLLNQTETPDGEQSRRRVANRSALPKAVAPLRDPSQSALKGSQPQSTNTTNVVPDSQMDVHLRDAFDVTEPGYGNHGETLAPAPTPVGGESEYFGDGVEGGRSSQPEIPETLQDNLALLQPTQSFQPSDETHQDRERHKVRPSSSATSVDLFKQHETHLEAVTDPLTATRVDSRSLDHSQTNRGHGHPTVALNSLIAPRHQEDDPEHIIYPGLLTSGYISPKPLRSSTQFRERFITPAPESSTSPGHGIFRTPTTHKDRYQPNSAAKRSTDGKGPPPKRLDRHPERVTVQQPPKTTTHIGSESSQGKSSSDHRKGGSVVGAPAPAPGKSRKQARPTRKNSRKDKYTERFSQKS